MSIRTTDREHVALYDSVTGMAFGPTFADAEHAEHFLAWLRERNNLPPQGIGPVTLGGYYDEWFRTCCDPETGILLAEVA